MKISLKDYLTWKKDLNKIIVGAFISPKLREAVCETLKALQIHNWNLAYQLTAVKSHVTGILDPKDKAHAFQEDHDANVRILDSSVYSILNSLHHAIALSINEIPAGSMVLSGNGKVSVYKTQGSHPIVRRIKYEQQQIEKGVERQDHEKMFVAVPSTRKVNWK